MQRSVFALLWLLFAAADFAELKLQGDAWGLDLIVDVGFRVNLRMIRLEEMQDSTIRVSHPSGTVLSKSEDDVRVTLVLSQANPDQISNSSKTDSGGGSLKPVSAMAGLLALLLAMVGRGEHARMVAVMACSLALILMVQPASGVESDLPIVDISFPDTYEFRSVNIETAPGSTVTWFVQNLPISDNVTSDGDVCTQCGATSGAFPEPAALSAFTPFVGCVDSESNLIGEEYIVFDTLEAMRDHAVQQGKAFYAVSGYSGSEDIVHGFIATGYTQLSTGLCTNFGDVTKKNDAGSASWAVYETDVVPETSFVGTGDRVSSSLRTCNAYCSSQGMACQGAWEDDASQSCVNFLAEETCGTDIKAKYSDTSDMCCKCGEGGTNAGGGQCPAAASGDELCTSLSTSSTCEYKATTGGENCDTFCDNMDLRCVDSWDDNAYQCVRSTHDTGDLKCTKSRYRQICTCSRPGAVTSPTSAPPPSSPPDQVTTPSSPQETALDCGSKPEIKNAINQFTKNTGNGMGPMVGAVSATTVNIWAYYPDQTTAIRYWPASDGGNTKETGMSIDDRQYTSRVTLSGLAAGTSYKYQLLVGGVAKKDGKFKTAPENFKPTKLKYFLGSCLRIQVHKNQLAWEHANMEEIDLAVMGGDNIYLPAGTDSAGNNDYGYIAKMKRHAEQRTVVPEMATFLRNTATIATWDDHDFGPNNSDEAFEHKKCSRQGFRHMWANPSYGEDKEGIYSRMLYGQVEFFIVDNRYFKKDSREIYAGSKQMAWLTAALEESHNNGVVFKIIVHGGTIRRAGSESWFESSDPERRTLLDFIENKGITGILFNGGDVHKQWVNPYPRCPRSSGRPHHSVYEIVSSGLSYSNNMHTIFDVDTTVSPPKIVYGFWARTASQANWEEYERGTFTLEGNGHMKHEVNRQTGRSTTLDSCQLTSSYAGF